jgi:NAD-dependent deacetylase
VSVAELQAALASANTGLIVVVTGAGISLASGIPTFRGTDPDAIWQRDITELGTYRFFRHDPVGSWRFTLKIFEKVPGARPNPAHEALAALEQWQVGRGGRFLVITQNVDTLHEQAGSRELVKVHGSVDRIRCSSPLGCRHGAPRGTLPSSDFDVASFLAAPDADALPRCPICQDFLRPHVLWFDEFYAEHDDYQWSRVQEAAHGMARLVFVGTSFAVGVTEVLLQAARYARIPAFSIDPTLEPPRGITAVQGKAEDVLPAVVADLLRAT